MDASIIRAVNKLWLPVYPGIAGQIGELCASPPGRMLEAGCFSGGIGLTLLQQFPQSTLTVAPGIEELVTTFSSDWAGLLERPAADRVRVVPGPPPSLDGADKGYDLIICRGLFFFLDGEGALLTELYRLLSPGGLVFAGGGYGAYTPREIIDRIADESRRLNDALGRKFFSREEFGRAIAGAGLAGQSRIIEEGGLWVSIKKTQEVCRRGVEQNV
jgi:SAM-dependent methyltransferase